MKTNLDEVYFEIIFQVEKIRNNFFYSSEEKLLKSDFNLIYETLSPFKKVKTVEIFLDDCLRSVGRKLDFSNTRDYIFQKKEPIVISFFSAPYNKAFGLDALVYETVSPDLFFQNKYKFSNATSINILKMTTGFNQYPDCVALFPENFCSQSEFKSNFSVFYFLNIFERRFQEYGKPALEKFIHQSSFWRLRRLTKETRLKAFATWHYLHEYFHSQGYLPITEYLKLKSKRKIAAIEESRVDILAILECMDSISIGYLDGYLYVELILFERLIRYSIHSEPEINYDALASHILFKFLQGKGAIDIQNHTLRLNVTLLKDSLVSYSQIIEQLEKEILIDINNCGNSKSAMKFAQEKFISFSNTYTNNGVIMKNNYFKNIEAILSNEDSQGRNVSE